MPRRKIRQSENFVAHAYKNIATNANGLNAQQLRQMRIAADRLALMDEVFTIEQLIEPAEVAVALPPVTNTDDQILENLRAKHQVEP